MASEKSVEEKFQKKSLHEHILSSPEVYMDSIEIKKAYMKSFLTLIAYSTANKQKKIKEIAKLNNASVVELERSLMTSLHF